MKNKAIPQSKHYLVKILAILLLMVGILFGIQLYLSFSAEARNLANPIIIWLGVILFFGKLSGFVEKFGHPSVLGELFVGAVLGNLVLIGVTFMEPAKSNATMIFLTQLGSIILFFQAGLATDINNIRAFIKRSFALAVLGLFFSVGTYYFLLPYLIPGQKEIIYLYVAFALSPTGAGVTARVLQDLGKLHLKQSQFIISTGALDNIISFTIQAILIAYMQSNIIDVNQSGSLIIKVLILILTVILFGSVLLPKFSNFIAEFYPSRSLKFAFSFSIALFTAFFAQSIGIAPVIGAFLAGLAISPTYFTVFRSAAPLHNIEQSLIGDPAFTTKKFSKHIDTIKKEYVRDLEEMFTTPAFLLVSIFFVVTGMSIDVRMFANPQYLFAALIITGLAFVTKVSAAILIERKVKSITGIGMSPRGVTTLVFATIGKRLGFLSPEMLTLIIFVVMLTTFITPLIMTPMFKKLKVE